MKSSSGICFVQLAWVLKFTQFCMKLFSIVGQKKICIHDIRLITKNSIMIPQIKLNVCAQETPTTLNIFIHELENRLRKKVWRKQFFPFCNAENFKNILISTILSNYFFEVFQPRPKKPNSSKQNYKIAGFVILTSWISWILTEIEFLLQFWCTFDRLCKIHNLSHTKWKQCLCNGNR